MRKTVLAVLVLLVITSSFFAGNALASRRTNQAIDRGRNEIRLDNDPSYYRVDVFIVPSMLNDGQPHPYVVAEKSERGCYLEIPPATAEVESAAIAAGVIECRADVFTD